MDLHDRPRTGIYNARTMTKPTPSRGTREWSIVQARHCLPAHPLKFAPTIEESALISFACRTCSQAYKVPVDKAGKHSRCARCKEPLAVPRPDQMWWRQAKREDSQPPTRAETDTGAALSTGRPVALLRQSNRGMWALVVVVLVMSCVGIGVYINEKNEDRRRADEERDRAAPQAIGRSEVDSINCR